MPRLASAGVIVAVLGCRGPSAATPVPTGCGPGCPWAEVVAGVDSAVRSGAAPGATVGISAAGRRFFHAAGVLGIDDHAPTSRRTIYDLASLTKVVALTTVTMVAVERGAIDLDAPVVRYLPEFAGQGKDRVTVRHLLTHSSGLPAHRPLWRESSSEAAALTLVASTPLDTAAGVRMVYSDLGAILVTQLVERALGQPIDRLFDRLVSNPLGLRSSRYRPPAGWLPRIAPTERDPWRGRIVRGEVHDENAAFLGGISGHAGLFGTVEDLVRFGEWLLAARRGLAGPGPKLTAATVLEFTRRQDLVPGSSRALGWDTPSSGSSAGTRLSPASFGHTGFTGTSIWIDPTRDLVIVLLSNRVHPTRDNPRLGPLRVLVADRTVAALDAGAR
ncbi:MAG: beta-lactamase family protein [Gemmatimonadetes bacterium]|nr:beta-lactamase family protein [Gemmatimonadota bacterium]